MAGKVNLKTDKSLQNVFINDFLSRDTIELLNHAKSVKAVGYKFVFVRGGKVFIRKNENSRVVGVRSMDEVDKVLLESSQGGVPAVRRARTDVIDSDISDAEDGNTFRSPL